MAHHRESLPEQALLELTQWLARVMQYSASHPACAPLADKTHRTLLRALEEQSPLDVGVLTDGVTIGETACHAPALRARLGPHLHERGIVVLRFLPNVTIDELRAFVELLTILPQEAFERGGFERLVADAGITHIHVKELAHDVTTEGRDAQKRRTRLRDVFRDMLRSLIAERGFDAAIGEYLAELLKHPDIAVTILEEDPVGIAEAVAGLALMAQQEEARTGAQLAARVCVVFETLSARSRGRVLMGFPTLAGQFRAALAWVMDGLDEQQLARFVFPAVRAHADDLDAVLYALGVAVPDDLRRLATLRWTALGFADLPADDALSGELIATAARPVEAYESFRDERETLRAQAARALAVRSFVAAARTPSVPPLPHIPSNPGMPAIADAPIVPAAAAHAVMTSSAPPALMSEPPPPFSIPPMPAIPMQRRAPPAFNGRRTMTEVIQIATRVGGLARVCRTLPAAASALADEGATDALSGVVRGLRGTESTEHAPVVSKALRDLGASTAATKILAAIDAAITAADGEELDDMLAAIKLVVAGSPLVALQRLEASDNRKMRRALLDAMPLAADELLPVVRTRLVSSNWFVVRNAVLLVARCGGTPRDLEVVASHPNEKVRLEVVRALRSMPVDEATMDIAAEHLLDESHEVAIGARALLRGDPLGPRALVALERIATDEEKPEDLRRRVVDALGQSTNDGAATILYEMLQPRSLIDIGGAAALRDHAAATLRRSRANAAAALFAQGLASTNRRVRKACERAAEGG